MKKLFAILLFFPLLAAGQTSSTMRFAGGEVWDFGEVREIDGVVEHTFTFTNSGRISFAVEKVSVDCGCTTPLYTREPVGPKGEGWITVRFDPKDQQAGAFEKAIRVTSKGGRNKNTLTIRGTVVPRPKSIAEEFPFAMGGGLRLQNLSLNWGYIEQGTAREMAVKYINASAAPVKLEWEVQPRRAFVHVNAPPVIAAGARGEIKVTYDLRRTRFYGRYSDRVYLTVNGTRQMLPLSTTFTAVDPPVEGPDAVIAPLFEHHGNVRRGEKLTRTLEIANDGTAPLIIRWVEVRKGMSTSLKEGLVVQPGAAAKFTVTMDTAAMDTGVQTGAVTIITNDPVRPVRDIRSAANVK
jgi:hypothetical protein